MSASAFVDKRREKWRIRKRLGNYSPSQVYNVDEIQLNFDLMVLSVVFCRNADANHRIHPFFVSNLLLNKAFSKPQYPCFAVRYGVSISGHFNTELFRSWANFFKTFEGREGNNVLLMDRATYRTAVGISTRKVQVEFLPSLASPLLQPLELGITQRIHTEFDYFVGNFTNRSIDSGLTPYGITINAVQKIW